MTWTQSTTSGAAAVVEPDGQRHPAPTTLWLHRLVLTAFRCYDGATLEADARPVVLTGPNGAGKTNILEAVSLLAPGRGLRHARLAEIGRRTEGARGLPDNQPWAVAARLTTPQGPREVGTGRDPAQQPGEGDRRLLKIDGALIRGQQALSEVLAMVWLTPQMDSLFRDSAGGRRRFLDRLVYGFDPSHSSRVNAYEQVLRERGRLLKSGQRDSHWLAALEESAARHGVAIAAARRLFVARLATACAAGTGPFPTAGLGLEGEVEAWLDDGSALQVEDRLRARLAQERARDAEAGGAQTGPHRSDLAVTDLTSGMAAGLCSTGEQKALLLSIVLAYARLLRLDRGAPPLLLLDEVAAHLDEGRRAALFDEILALGCQAWLTGTDRQLFAHLAPAAQFFHVQAARITPVG